MAKLIKCSKCGEMTTSKRSECWFCQTSISKAVQKLETTDRLSPDNVESKYPQGSHYAPCEKCGRTTLLGETLCSVCKTELTANNPYFSTPHPQAKGLNSRGLWLFGFFIGLYVLFQILVAVSPNHSTRDSDGANIIGFNGNPLNKQQANGRDWITATKYNKMDFCRIQQTAFSKRSTYFEAEWLFESLEDFYDDQTGAARPIELNSAVALILTGREHVQK